MAGIHIFTQDWLSLRKEFVSGGGLRGLQLVEALRQAGHDVTFSVPSNCRHVQRLGRGHQSLRAILVHDGSNQIDILRDVRPEVVIWTPSDRSVPLMGISDIVHVYDMIGLPSVEAGFGAKAQIARNRERLTRLCQGIDLFLSGSEEQNGYWLSMLTSNGADVTTAIVPYALPASLSPMGGPEANRLQTLYVTGTVNADGTNVPLLRATAEWAARNVGVTISIIVETDPGAVLDPAALLVLETISRCQNVELHGMQTYATAMGNYSPGSMLLDIFDSNVENRLAVPVRAVTALAHGVPVVTTVDSTFTRQIESASAGLVVEDPLSGGLERTLDRVAALRSKELADMSRAARAFAAERYDFGRVSETLDRAIRAALSRKTETRKIWLSSMPKMDPLGHILVLTDTGSSLTDVRVQIPFGAMHARGLIDGYSVWHEGKFIFSTSPDPTVLPFAAIWVQRELRAEAVVALKMLGKPFAYDLDDNLLAPPSYRPAFPTEFQQMVRNLLYSCAVLSCSTARLAQELERSALSTVRDKAVVTPNLTRNLPAFSPAGAPRSVVWISSDNLPLTASALPVLKAIRDFCLNHQIRLVCVGEQPHDVFIESMLNVQHVGPVSYGAYLSLLQSFAPSIMVCPLETEGDSVTQSFVNGKSDIKILEAIASGLIGVFSRAAPYQDSDLPDAILADNTYSGWYEGLTQAWHLCNQGRPAPELPETRRAATLGVRPWFEALSRARLQSPLPARAFRDAVMIVRGRHPRQRLSEAEFDEAFYVQAHPDIRAAIERGEISSAYAHYESEGFAEKRQGRPGDPVGPGNNQLWANFLHTIGDLRGNMERRQETTERLKAQRAARVRLRRGLL